MKSVSRRELIADAERCVKCALCLPHCPTYGLKGEEGDSPRGRIALIQALAEGTLAPSAATIEHLDGCLDCRACEAVCPAYVPYGRLIDGARAALAARGKPSWRTRFALRPYLRALGRPPPLARGSENGEPAALFLGCVARTLDGDTLRAGAELLAAAGYRVEVPPGQTCCGALALHAGDRATARRLAARNRAAFADRSTIVAAATGCTAQLAEYDELLTDGGAFSRRVSDVTELLARALEAGRLSLHNERPLRVALHTPCTQRNVLRSDAGRRCLQRLPNVKLIELPPGCCGAAGSYFLDRPRDAAELRAPLLAAIRDARPDCVVTANVGCRLHLAAGLADDGGAPEVMHLASLLAHCLGPGALKPANELPG